MNKLPKIIIVLGGVVTGLVNGLLGTGGGMVAVPVLRGTGLKTREVHAGAISVIFPLSVLSAIMYLTGGHVEFSSALPFIPGGIIGAVAGAIFLRKISPVLLRRIFGGFALWAGIRLIVR